MQKIELLHKILKKGLVLYIAIREVGIEMDNQARLRMLTKQHVGKDALHTSLSGKDKTKLLKAMKEKEKQKNESIMKEKQTFIHHNFDNRKDDYKPIKKVTLSMPTDNDHDDNSNGFNNNTVDIRKQQTNNVDDATCIGLLANYEDDSDNDDNYNIGNNNTIEASNTTTSTSINSLPNDFFDNDINDTTSTASTNILDKVSSSSIGGSQLPEGFFDEQYKPSSASYTKQTTSTCILSTTNNNTISITSSNKDNELSFLTKLEQEIATDADDEVVDDGVDDEQDDNIEETLQLAYKTKLAALLMKVNNDKNDNMNKTEILDSAREASDFVETMMTNTNSNNDKKRSASSNQIHDDVVTSALLRKRNEKKKKQKLLEEIPIDYLDNNWNSQSLFM